MKDIQGIARTFLEHIKPENYRNDRFQVSARHLHGTTPSSIATNLGFEIRYRYGKEKNSNQLTNNNIVYHIDLFVKDVVNFGKLLIHQIKIVAPENEFINLPICLQQLQKEAENGAFPNYL